MMRIRKRRSEPVYRANWLSEFEWTDAVDRRDEGSEAAWSSSDDVFQLVRYMAERGAMTGDMIRALSVFVVPPPEKGDPPADPWIALWCAACSIRRNAVIAQRFHEAVPWARVREATDAGVEEFRRFVDNAPRSMDGEGWKGEVVGWNNAVASGIVDGLPFIVDADRYWMNGIFRIAVADRPEANPEDIDDTMGWDSYGMAPTRSSGLATGRTLSVAAVWRCVREGIDMWRRRNSETEEMGDV